MDDLKALCKRYSAAINSLPDDALLPILDRFPLFQLAHFPVQSGRRWQQLVERVCARKSSLTLLPTPGAVKDFTEFHRDYCFGELEDAGEIENITIKDGGIVALESDKPNIISSNYFFLKPGKEDLIFNFNSLKSLALYKYPLDTQKLSKLLSANISTLESLVLYILENSKINWAKIWTILNRAHSLKSLALFNCKTETINLPNVLPQLESFSIGLFCGDLMPPTKQLNSANLKRLAVFQVGLSYSMNELMTKPKLKKLYNEMLNYSLDANFMANIYDEASLDFLHRIARVMNYANYVLDTLFTHKPDIAQNLTHMIVDHYEHGEENHGFTEYFCNIFLKHFAQNSKIKVMGFLTQFGIDKMIVPLKLLSNMVELHLGSFSIDLFAGMERNPQPLTTVRTLEYTSPTLCLRTFARALLIFPNIEKLIFKEEEMKISCPLKRFTNRADNCAICWIELKKLLLAFPKLRSPKIAPLTKRDEELYKYEDLSHFRIEWTRLGIREQKFIENKVTTNKDKKNEKKGSQEKNINALDDDSLMMILDSVSLNDLLKICQFVCPRWYTLVFQVCAKKTTLMLYDVYLKDDKFPPTHIANYQYKLFHTDFWKESYATKLHRSCLAEDTSTIMQSLSPYSNSLLLPCGDGEVCRQLCRIFPNIKHLTMASVVIKSEDVRILFNAWAPQLETLNILAREPHSFPVLFYRFDFQALARSIDKSMPHLRELNLNCVLGPIKLPSVSAELEELSIRTYEFGDLYKALASIDDTRLKRLHISHQERTKIIYPLTFGYVEQNPDLLEGITPLADLDYTFNVLKRLIVSKPKLRSNLTHLTLECDSHGEDGIGIDFLEFVCENFLALVAFIVQLDEKISMSQLCLQLSKLKNLNYLSLISGNLKLLDDLPTGEIDAARIRLPSLTTFHAFIPLDAKKFSQLNRVMPSLKYVHFRGTVICVRTNAESNEEFYDHIKHYCQPCYHEVRTALEAFPHLAPMD